MTPLPTALCFDVEDLVAPESDDAALWFADILAEYGLPGSFMVVGERFRQWEARGRRDVVEALKRHHVAFHSTWHSVHPTTTEICLDKDFAAGMDAVWEWDRQGWADAERILGRPLIGWSLTGSSWSPSIMGLAGRMGRAYAYSLVRLPGHSVCWYAGCLGFHHEAVGVFDEALCDDALFAERLALTNDAVDRRLAADRRGAEWLRLFVCHPTRAIHTAFWDLVNFSGGANPPRSAWKPAPRLDGSRFPIIQNNFHRLCESVRSDPRLEIVGWGDLIRRYDGQRAFASHAEVLDMAQRLADERRVLFTDFFTAGEVLLLLCRAASDSQPRYPRPTVYGPLTTPPITPTPAWDASDIAAAAPDLLRAAETGFLPPSIGVARQMVGIGTYAVALAEALLGGHKVSGPADAPYPPEAEAVAREAARMIPDWLIHPAGMDLTLLLEQARLQCWTLKPAWPREELSPPNPQ